MARTGVATDFTKGASIVELPERSKTGMPA
jgi:hypothetical protein